MKKILFVLCLFSATAVFAQYYGTSTVSSQPQPYHPPDHPAHAAYAPMLQERSVIAATSYASAQGDRPASDFPQPESTSLGTYAREIKKQHSEAKKSRVVWVNQ
ncbi:MAG: hypothetical protein ABSD75_08780 [Terriglobales bacterium]|jgi:hypothetical protein